MRLYPDRNRICTHCIPNALWKYAQYITNYFIHPLLGLFAIGAPGVPGGTVLASLGLIISVLHFNEAGTALLLTIFALQDSFGTACNITGDAALTLITDTFEKKIASKPKAFK